MSAPSRAVAAAVHRPLAEQIAALLGPVERRRVLDVDAGDGEVAARLGLLGALVDTVALGTLTSPHPESFALGRAQYDVAVSLLCLDNDENLPARLNAMQRWARRCAAVVWEDGATHAISVGDACRDAGAAMPVAAARVTEPRPPAEPPPGWQRTVLSDVARFDGVGELHAAVLGEGAGPMTGAVRTALHLRLASHIAADGTLRIPIRAALLRTL